MLMTIITGIGSADEINIELLSNFGGNAYDIEVVGKYAYLGQGQDLVVLDITDINKPSEIGRVITPSLVTAIDVSGNYAYVADGSSGLTIVNITNPEAPKIMGTYTGTYDTPAYSVAVSGNYAYVTNEFPGNLEIIDISNPSSPKLVGNYDTSDNGNANGVAISGNCAYVAAGGLIILDIANPISPQLVSTYNDDIYALDVVIEDNYAYVADAYKGLVILDITDPASPILVGNYIAETGIGYTRIAVSDGHVYGTEYNGLSIIDISDPVSPDLMTTYTTDHNTNGLVVAGDYTYLIGSGLEIVDTSNPSLPSHVSNYYNGDWALDASVAGNYAYITGWNGLTIADISNPSSPIFVGNYDIDEAEEVDAQGNYAYVASGGIDSVLVSIIDVTIPSSPTLAGSSSIFADSGVGIDVQGNYAYTGVGFPGLSILDISDPASPQFISDYGSYGPENYTSKVVVSGNYAYVPHDLELSILDITDPSSPLLVSIYGTTVSDVAVSGKYAYLAAGALEIVDITNPAAPKLAGSYDSISASYVAVSDDYAYVVGENSLAILDISNPSSPKLAGTYDSSEINGYVTVADGYVYVANKDRGLTILRVETSSVTDIETTVSYTPAYDNRLRESSPNSVLSTTTYLDIGKSSYRCRDVMWFDLSDYQVTDTIEKAILSLYWYYPQDTTRASDTVVEIYRPEEWDPKFVTWRSRMSGMLWNTAGGNWYDMNNITKGTTPYASVTFTGNTAPDNKYYEFDVTQLVQEYVSGKYKNTGFFLKAKTESGNYIAFYSSDWPNNEQKPMLTITTASVSIDNPPVANAGADKTATTGSAVTFNGSASTDDKGIESYSWDFDASDSITSEASGVTATKTYDAAGTYTVTLTVTDTGGQKSNDVLQVVVTGPVSTASYTPVYDNRLRESSPNSVLSTTTYLDIGKSSYRCRDVMHFDLSSYGITDTISKATLSLYWYYPAGTTRTSDTVVEVYRPVEWDSKYVTWRSRMSGVPWKNAGGEWFDMNGVSQGATPYASVIFSGSKAPDNRYYEFDVTHLVQEYVNGTYANTGFLLKAKTESGNYIAFYSSEWPDDEQKPILTITG